MTCEEKAGGEGQVRSDDTDVITQRHQPVLSTCVYLFTAVEMSDGGNEEFYNLWTQVGQLGGAP